VDGDLLGLVGEFASVMCDGSARPFDENVRLTAEYVEQVRGKVVVEGAVDVLPEAGDGSGGMELTTVEQAVRFVEETGVDMIVPNVGTEHRATALEVRYNGDRARAISAAVGRIMCIHGTSSVAADQIAQLPMDGFVKVNVFTTLAVHAGQAVARRVLADIRSYFGDDDIAEMVGDGVLGPAAAAGEPAAPRLKALATSTRRDAWSTAVQERCSDFLTAFGYERVAD
jgi:fructose-bisphosphate aldolase class II